MKSKAQIIQENLLAELEKVSEIEFFKKAGKAVSGVATGLDKLSKIQNYDPAKPTVKKKPEEDPLAKLQAKWDAEQKEIEDAAPAARKAMLMKKLGKSSADIAQYRKEKVEKAAIAKSIARQKKKRPSSIATGIAKSTPVAPTPVPGQKAKATKQSKLPTIGGILPTDPRYPALAAKIAAAEKNK
mgnify:CR=1 FL=1|jgi:hypothetical protein